MPEIDRLAELFASERILSGNVPAEFRQELEAAFKAGYSAGYDDGFDIAGVVYWPD